MNEPQLRAYRAKLCRLKEANPAAYVELKNRLAEARRLRGGRAASDELRNAPAVVAPADVPNPTKDEGPPRPSQQAL